MIPFDFDYYKPDTIQEAVQIFKELDAQGRSPVYYGGGTEIISMARVNNISTQAVVDLKGIPECNIHGFQDNNLVVGSTVTLTQIAEARYFHLLAMAVGRIADHTIQGKITLGGNLAGTIIYHEAVLPLMLTDCQVKIAGPNGMREVQIREVFNQRIQLSRGEFIQQVSIAKDYMDLPFVHVKKTHTEKIGYPLLTIAALKKDERIRAAFTGVCEYPFRSSLIEDALNNKSISCENRADEAMSHWPDKILNNIDGSNAYRKFVLKNTLVQTLETFERMIS